MNSKRKIEPIVRTVSFAEAELEEVEYYANNTWKQSVSIVEEIRRSIWNEAYNDGRKKDIVIANLKADRDEFE